jgi:hypothetical protein
VPSGARATSGSPSGAAVVVTAGFVAAGADVGAADPATVVAGADEAAVVAATDEVEPTALVCTSAESLAHAAAVSASAAPTQQQIERFLVISHLLSRVLPGQR